MKITIIGVGNIGGAIARGLSQGSIFKASDISCADMSEELLKRMTDFNPDFKVTTKAEEVVAGADILIVAVKPWRVESVFDQIKDYLNLEKQIIISIAAGVTFQDLQRILSKGHDCMARPSIFRVMPNTAIEKKSSMTFVASHNATAEQEQLVVNIFNELGNAMLIEERLMGAGTALASSGIAFALRYIRAAMEGGVELGFYPKQAQEAVAYTVKGAVDLLLANQSNPETEIDKVTTPGGTTIKGLNEMEHAGFTSAVIRGLKACK